MKENRRRYARHQRAVEPARRRPLSDGITTAQLAHLHEDLKKTPAWPKNCRSDGNCSGGDRPAPAAVLESTGRGVREAHSGEPSAHQRTERLSFSGILCFRPTYPKVRAWKVTGRSIPFFVLSDKSAQPGLPAEFDSAI
jgi:hypothetical protein